MPGRLLGKATKFGEGAQCSSCGYALAGLKQGAPCPECGTATAAKSVRGPLVGGTLVQAPMAYLRIFVIGCVCMLLGIAGWIVGIPIVMAVGKGLGAITLLPAFVMGMVLWTLGVWIITIPRRTGQQAAINTHTEWKRLRVATRTLHVVAGCGFVVLWGASAVIAFAAAKANAVAATAGAGVLAGPAVTPISPALAGIAVLGVLLSLAALPAMASLGMYMAHLADWALDHDLAARLRLAASGIAVGPVLVLVFLIGVPLLGVSWLTWTFIWLGWIGAGVALLCMVQFGWATLQFANMARWAMKNAQTQARSDLDKVEAHVERFASRPLREDESPAFAEHDPAANVPRSTGKNVLRAQSTGEVFGLADSGAKPGEVRRHARGK